MFSGTGNLLSGMFFLLVPISLCAQKTDKVFLNNGDLITCEIVELSLGKLDCKTNDIGRLQIEWDAIDSIWSDKQFEIHLKDGTIVFTSLDSSFYEYGNYAFDDMIELLQIKKKGLSRFDGNVDLGFSYTKSSEIFQLNFDSKIYYNFYRTEVELSVSSLLTIETDESTTNRNNIKLGLKRSYQKNNFLLAFGGYDRNTELGIDARYIVGGGFGNYLIYQPKTRLSPAIGISVNEEFSIESSSSGVTNFEVLGYIDFRKFNYNDPELDIYSGLKLYANLNDFGRIRGEFDFNLRIEVINDFFIKLVWYYNFDNRPIDEMAAQNDWAATLTLSYSF